MVRVIPGRAERGATGARQGLPALSAHSPYGLSLRPIGRHSLLSRSPRRAASSGGRGGGDRAGRACGSAACAAAKAACVEWGALNARLAKPQCVARLSHATSKASIAGRSR